MLFCLAIKVLVFLSTSFPEKIHKTRCDNKLLIMMTQAAMFKNNKKNVDTIISDNLWR